MTVDRPKRLAGEPLLKLESTSPDSITSTILNNFNWYNVHKDSSDAKQYILDYLVATESNEIADQVALVPLKYIKNAIGWICRQSLLTKAKFPTSTIKTMKKYLDEYKALGKKYYDIQQQELNSPKPIKHRKTDIEIQEELFSYYIGEINFEIDSLIDSKFTDVFDAAAWLKETGVSRIDTERIKSFYLKTSTELRQAVEKKDPELVEAYSCFTKADLKTLYNFFVKLDSACAAWMKDNKSLAVPKASNKIRKPRKIVPEKLVKRLRFLDKTDKFDGLQSISPVKIVGASSLWVFNIKTRYLGCYIASDDSGLSVKGSSIINFSETDSISKKLRKPGKTIKDVLDAGKVALRKLLPGLSTKERALTGRLNRDTILLRIG